VAEHDLGLLIRGTRSIGISLDDGQLRRFERFGRLLLKSNRRANLTSITAWDDVQLKHFLDSLTLVATLRRLLPDGQGSIVDVGSGAGLPGIPLAMVFPRLQVTLLEATAKKVDFLEQAITALDLDNVRAVIGRVEDLGRLEEHAGQYDVAVARAVGSVAALVELLLPLVRVGGVGLLMKTHSALETELGEAQPALNSLGGETQSVEDLSIAGLLEDRALVVVGKVTATPPKYPRRAGMAQRRPIRGPAARSSPSSRAGRR